MKMKIRLNPIIKKDFQVAARSMRISWGLFAYEAVLAMAYMIAMSVIQEVNGNIYGEGNIYKSLIYLFPVLAIAQLVIVALIVPIMTSSSISGEKERQTFDIMMTTCMSPFSIVLGKVFSAVLRILFYVAAGMPIMALPFVVGGLKWSSLFYFLLVVVLISVLSGSIGIFCSSFCRRSITSVVMSFIIYFVLYFMTFVPALTGVVWSVGINTVGGGAKTESLLILLLNPFVFFEEFFANIMAGTSMLGTADLSTSVFESNEVGILTFALARGKLWLFASAVCIIIMSVLFMLAAAWKVNPMHAPSHKKKSKKGRN
ncbi:MAG: ABC transporter permease [Clostridiales bacterium]|nr:ABC transporter permease [Clostridiales bacterium]